MKMLLFIGLCLFVTSLGAIVLAQEFRSSPSRRIVILMGPPGSGKGTQAVRLSKELGIPHISTGDLFRENVGKSTDLGKKAKTYMDAGKLVPDELVLEMLFDRVSRSDASKGYLLDGFPRTIPQAEALNRHLSSNDHVTVINLDVADELIIKRIGGRFSCKQCGTIYNKYFSPSTKEGICDKCAGELQQRPDDTVEVAQERLKVYHAQTQPLIAYYTQKGILHNIDGTQTPDEVFKHLQKALQEKVTR